MVLGIVKMAMICDVDPVTMKSFLLKNTGYPASRDGRGMWIFEPDFEEWWMNNYAPVGRDESRNMISSSDFMRAIEISHKTRKKMLEQGLPHTKEGIYFYIDPMEAAQWLIDQGGRRKEWGEKLLAKYKES